MLNNADTQARGSYFQRPRTVVGPRIAVRENCRVLSFDRGRDKLEDALIEKVYLRSIVPKDFVEVVVIFAVLNCVPEETQLTSITILKHDFCTIFFYLFQRWAKSSDNTDFTFVIL